MKKLAILALAGVVMFACKKEPKKDYIVLSGKISNLDKKEVAIRGLHVQKTIKVNNDGTFTDTLRINKGYYTLVGDRKRVEIYLDKGSDLTVSFDAKSPQNSFDFKGSIAKENQYLLNKSELKSKLFGNIQQIYGLPEKEFLAKMNVAKDEFSKMIDTAKISDKFKAIELKNLNYNHIVNIFRYEGYHGYVSTNKEFKVSESFPDLAKGLDLNLEKDYKTSVGYRELVSGIIQNLTSAKMEKGKKDFTLTFMNTAKEKVSNQFILDDLLYNNARYGITYTEKLPEFYKTFMDSSKNEEHKKEITEAYNKLKAVTKGNPSPKFVNYENYNGGTTSLDDLKGKYVYIDVWATWCGPCKAEIPFLKEIEKKYHGKNIEFVSISIDTKKAYDTWKNMVKNMELGGIQLIADKNWHSQFVKDYSIQGIPRFILIDTNGNIVSANAPRPSSPDLVALFDELKI